MQKQTLSPGRWRGLKMTSNAQDIFTVLAFDQRGSYCRMLPEDATYEDAVQIKRQVARALAPHASAVLLDPIYGLLPAMDLVGSSGLLMAYEKSGYSGDSTYRKVAFIDDWTVGKIKRMGASAVKLLVYYHPGAGALADEIDGVVRQVADECHAHDLPLFVEPMSYSLDADISKKSADFAKTLPEVVCETARRLSRTGADVMKLEFPVDPAFESDEKAWLDACRAVGAASAAPWVLLSAGVDFEMFEPQVRAACAAGASGFLAGRAIWKEVVPMPPNERDRFLAEVAIPRIDTLSGIAASAARPWTDFYAPPAGGEGWYRAYGGAPD
ncbi:MAG: tagatose 1,6-diphosphate aldolase [Anaerolineae bacterium]|nr:tagatose 1,6-diphosphate aldolase [Anaerolineae bacterium]